MCAKSVSAILILIFWKCKAILPSQMKKEKAAVDELLFWSRSGFTLGGCDKPNVWQLSGQLCDP